MTTVARLEEVAEALALYVTCAYFVISHTVEELRLDEDTLLACHTMYGLA
jgi:hypothetical protein